MNAAQKVRLTKYILSDTKCFRNLVPKYDGLVPILKCYHPKTDYCCDLNFSDPYVVHISRFIKRLLKFDARVFNLALIIKYWMKVHGCAKKNYISNYGVIWLIVFYLQSRPDPILPPIIQFQNKKSQWTPNNRESFFELFYGFFYFYRDFDFRSHIISPLCGKAYRKSDILLQRRLSKYCRCESVLVLDPNLMSSILRKSICIQNPFDLSKFLPHYGTKSTFKQTRRKLSAACDIIGKGMEQTCENKCILLALFDKRKFKTFFFM